MASTMYCDDEYSTAGMMSQLGGAYNGASSVCSTSVLPAFGAGLPYAPPQVATAHAASAARKTKGSLIKELFGDLRTYIRDNRDLIFSIALVLVLDEYVFDGAFRERLKSVIEGVLKKVEKKTGIDIPGV